jgi:hypothetical protein
MSVQKIIVNEHRVTDDGSSMTHHVATVKTRREDEDVVGWAVNRLRRARVNSAHLSNPYRFYGPTPRSGIHEPGFLPGSATRIYRLSGFTPIEIREIAKQLGVAAAPAAAPAKPKTEGDRLLDFFFPKRGRLMSLKSWR